MISLQNLAMSYGARDLFEKVSLQLNEGVRYGITGANGSGKSTLLKLIAGREHASEGKIDIQKGIISGHDGCNNFGGRITIEGNRISFGNLYQTKVYCEKNNVAFEKIIQENVSGKVASYYFKEDKLYLYLLDDSLLVFKKK